MFRQRPQAERILDGFHIVSRATDALDKVRTEARRSGTPQRRQGPDQGRPVGAAEDESDLNAAQRARLECVANTNEALWTAYKLKERLGMILRQDADAGRAPAAPVGRGRIPVRHRGILEKLGEKIARRHFDIR